MDVVQLDRTWHLSIRSLIRSHFKDKHPTQFVAWDRGCMVVREEAPRLLGVCLVDADGYLRYLVVREGFRGQGLGSEMIRKCLHCIEHLTCMPALSPFYERHGFVVSRRDMPHGMLEMRKTH